jgi:hypothetical protein
MSKNTRYGGMTFDVSENTSQKPLIPNTTKVKEKIEISKQI